jgi:adenylosuccinate synthase
LPKNARAYLQKIAELANAKLTIASVGPNRDQTIVL